MALDKFTQITKSGIVTTINFECHHLHSTGIATFSSGSISAVDGTFTGDVSIGGTLTYQDVTNIDSVGLVTARLGLNVTAGVSTFAALIDANGGVDISGGSGLVASTAKISDLTDNRVVIGGSSGELEDSANLTFDGSNLGVGSKVTVTNANADSRNVNSLGADINAAWIRIGDKAAAKTFSNGLGIKFYDQGTAHWSTGTIGNQYYVSYTGSAGDELFPSSRVDALTFNTTGAAVFASDITAGGNLYIPDKIYHSGDTDTFISFPTANTITVETGGSERLRINSSGHVGVNTDFTGSQTWRNGQRLEIFGGGGNVTGELHLGANRGDSNQSVGSINFFDNSQDSTHRHIALIEADKTGSTSNKRGGDLIFFTKNDNVAAPTEKIRITSAGAVQIGNLQTQQNTVTHTSATKLHIDSTKSIKIARLGAGSVSSAGWYTVAKISAGAGNYFKCYASIGGNFTQDMCVMELTGSWSASGALSNAYTEPVFTAHRTGAHSTDRITRARFVKDGSNLTYLQIYIAAGVDSNTWGKSVLEYQIGAYSQNSADSGSEAMFAAGGSVTAIRTLEVDDNALCTNAGSYKFYSGGNATERLSITSTGLFGFNNTTPGGACIDATHSRTNAYGATSDHRGLAQIVARNASDAAGRFASISLVSGGGTQAEASINLVQTGNYQGDLTFKSRTAVSAWTERMRISSTGRLLLGTTDNSGYANRSVYLHKTDGDGWNYLSITGATSGGAGIVFGDDPAQNGGNYESYMYHNNGDNNFSLMTDRGNKTFRFYNDGDFAVLNGNLGVGVDPTEQLHVLKSHNGHTRAVIQNNWGANATAQLKLVAPTDELQLIKYASGAAAINLSNNSTIYASIGGAERLKIRGDSTSQTTHIVNTPSPGGNGVQSQYVTQPYGMSGNYTNFRVTVTATSWHSFFLKFYVSGYNGDAAYRWVTGYCNNGFGTIRHVHSYDGGDFGSGTLTHISGQSWRYDLSVNSNSVTHPVMHVELSVAGNGNVLGNGAVVCAIT